MTCHVSFGSRHQLDDTGTHISTYRLKDAPEYLATEGSRYVKDLYVTMP